MKENSKTRFDEEKLIGFARSYFAEGFPNPDRIGCPSADALLRLAQQPTSADLSITEHLGRCSPCFRQYQDLLGQVRAQGQPQTGNRLLLLSPRFAVIAAVVCLVIIGVSVALWISHKREVVHKDNNPIKINTPDKGVVVATYSPFSIGLTKATQPRGKNGTSAAVIKVPRNTLHLSVYLPIGSDAGEYRTKLSQGRAMVWSGIATAQIRDHRMVMEFDADLRSYPPGQYTLTLLSKGGLRLRQSVTLIDQPKAK